VVTTTKAIPGCGGMPRKNPSSASTPPAEAPMPTIGNGALSVTGGIPDDAPSGGRISTIF
jgi:hypothetical protein